MKKINELIRDGWQLSVFEHDHGYCGGNVVAAIMPPYYEDIKEYLELTGDEGGRDALDAFEKLLYPTIAQGENINNALSTLESNIKDVIDVYDTFKFGMSNKDLLEELRIYLRGNTTYKQNTLYNLSFCFSPESEEHLKKVEEIYLAEVKHIGVEPVDNFIIFLRDRVKKYLGNLT